LKTESSKNQEKANKCYEKQDTVENRDLIFSLTEEDIEIIRRHIVGVIKCVRKIWDRH